MTTSQPATEYLSHPMLTDIYNAYETEKRPQKGLILMIYCSKPSSLFKKNSFIQKRFQEKIRHILVDEYQDTNVVQHEFLKEMALKR